MYIQNIALDENAIAIANNSSYFNAGTERTKEAKDEFKKFAELFPIHGELTVEQVSYLVSRQAEWAKLVTQAYNDIVRRRMAWVPVTVADPAGYNPNKIALHVKLKRFLTHTRKTLKKMTPLT